MQVYTGIHMYTQVCTSIHMGIHKYMGVCTSILK